MNTAPQKITSNELPTELPIFPLTGVLLLPHGQLPLNIFEPRYLAMTEDALGQGRMIGMVQPRESGSEAQQENPPVYEIGCAGRISAFSETGDGRYHISLLGVSRFRIEQELESVRGYRRVRPDYTGYADDLLPTTGELVEREECLKVIKTFFTLKTIEADWGSIKDTSDETIITSLSMACPFAPNEKQALLECSGLHDRGALLMSLMNMAVHDAQESPAQQTH